MAAIPRDSSSVILVQRAARGAQSLLVRRHTDLAFGGSWVFPGGKLEPSDGSAETLACLGLEDVDPKIAALMVGACREAFEETGLVLARGPGGEFCEGELAESLQPLRAAVSQDPARFPAMLVQSKLRIDAAHLLYWAHWITPSIMPRRYDTRFFVSEMPPGQSVRCDSAEATDLLWLDLPANGALPDAALIQAPPTRFSLAELGLALAQHGSIERLFERETAHVVHPVMPKILRNGQETLILLPWDAEYPAAAGEGTSTTQIPPPYLGFPSRLEPPKFITDRSPG